jgi:hypothetical protein
MTVSQVNAEHITVECKCGKRLKAPASAVGKKAKCPKCGNVMRIEAPPPPPPPEEPGEGEFGLDALYEVAAKEERVAASQEGQATAAMRCPSCGSGVEAGAVICVSCGYDFRTNRKVAPKAETVVESKKFGWFGGGAKKDKPVDKMAPQGSFFVGVAACAAFALVGAMIWVTIAYFTDRQFGIVAMGVGALAGLGMQIGQKGFSKLGGAVAAGMTLLAIIAANVAYFVLVVAVAVASVDVDEDFEAEAAKYDSRVVENLTRENLKAAGVNTGSDENDEDEDDLTDAAWEAYEQKYNAARREAVEKLKKMPKAEYDKLVKKLDEDEVRDQLVGRLTSVVLKERSVPDWASDYDLHYKSAQEEAEKRVAAMTPADQKKELQRLSDQADKELREEIAKARAERAAKGESDEDAPGAAQAGFFLVLLLLIFGWKSILFVILGMFFAYRTAAGSVHG